MSAVNNQKLAQLIRAVSEAVDKCDVGGIAGAVAPLREVVAPNCHVGEGEKMDHTDAGYRMQMEWFAGQLLSMVDEQQWFGINSWINCTEKFTTQRAAPTQQGEKS